MVMVIFVRLSMAMVISVPLSVTISAIPLTLSMSISMVIPLSLTIPLLLLHILAVIGSPAKGLGPTASQISEPSAVRPANCHCNQGSE